MHGELAGPQTAGPLLVGIAVAPDGTVAIAPGGDDPGRITTIAEAGAYDQAVRPRWVTWSQETARRLVTGGVRVATCWDVAAVHRMMFGGWRADPGYVWALLHGLSPGDVPADEPPDLFSSADETDEPVGADGHLRPEWTRGGWARTPETLLAWARLAREAAERQRHALAGADEGTTGGQSPPGDNHPFGIDGRTALRGTRGRRAARRPVRRRGTPGRHHRPQAAR